MQNRQVASYTEASGAIQYNMTNNYMFRYILQKNKKALKGLIAALLHLKPEDILDVEIINPIELSGDVAGKEFVLDIKVMLNDSTLINLEMQNLNEYNWPERSLSYLCRSFDQLYRGQEYEEALPVIHIGFLDFTLHPEAPEFYATYKMLNVKNYLVYSDKFTLSVVNLKEINRATEEDKAYQIDYWARIFKAKTWEDIKMLAKENEYMQEAANSLYVANADEIVREQCRAREDAERRERTLERDKRRLSQENSELVAQVSEQAAQLSEKDAQLREKDRNTARALFQNGVDYNIVRMSIPSLSDDELQDIYQKAQEEREL